MQAFRPPGPAGTAPPGTFARSSDATLALAASNTLADNTEDPEPPGFQQPSLAHLKVLIVFYLFLIQKGWSEKNKQKTCKWFIQVLREMFGHSHFKALQWRILHAIMFEKKDVICVMATGYGKSLCYQFPAVALGALSVVVSPLIALMQVRVDYPWGYFWLDTAHLL
jgi:hypothetical protein